MSPANRKRFENWAWAYFLLFGRRNLHARQWSHGEEAWCMKAGRKCGVRYVRFDTGGILTPANYFIRSLCYYSRKLGRLTAINNEENSSGYKR